MPCTAAKCKGGQLTMRYYAGELPAERPTTPRENHEPEDQDFDYESFSGTYSCKRFIEERPKLYASIVIRPATRRMKAMRRLTSDHGTLDRLFNGIGLDAA